jgi:hypothetical protein
MCRVIGEAQVVTDILLTYRQVKNISQQEGIPVSFKQKLGTTKYS